ncbi:MAG TPA: DUF6272 family protein [Polyangiaceae bacterium]|jgi:hypothetical protein|nr:DUF6272 family protein [Polyangiaceae bacterium]
MTGRNTRSINLRDAWEELKRVRASVEDYFRHSNEELRSAATMAALELAENVIKHGVDAGMVSVGEENGEVVISTQNRVRSPLHAQQVRSRIERLGEKGARELYIARMLEIMQQPNTDQTGLGLLRVAYEGSFRLSCEVLGDRLYIHAKRGVHALPS